MNIKSFLEKIDFKKSLLDKHRPLNSTLVKNLDQWLNVELAYTSNAIEGNTLTRAETALVIEKGLTIGGKSMREHLEAINHSYALDYIKVLVQKSHKEITLSNIKDIHRLILKGIDDKNAGAWRTINVKISGSTLVPPDQLKIPELMEKFIIWLSGAQEHPVIIALDTHYKLVSIHPFVDGNGRTARLLLNLILIQAGYCPLIIQPERRIDYINSLHTRDVSSDNNNYYLFMLDFLDKTFDIYLDIIK